MSETSISPGRRTHLVTRHLRDKNSANVEQFSVSYSLSHVLLKHSYQKQAFLFEHTHTHLHSYCPAIVSTFLLDCLASHSLMPLQKVSLRNSMTSLSQ